jgi:hypothetical protein
MPPRKRPTSGQGKGSGKADRPADSAGRSGGGGRGSPPESLERNPDADPVRIHREYVQERLAGGALPTQEAYERALDQWHQLAGAVRGPAGEVHPPAERLAGELERAEEEFTEEAAAERGAGYEGDLPATDPGDNSPYEDRVS